MADNESPIPSLPRRRPLFWNGGRVEGFLEGIERRFERMGTFETVLVAGAGVLVLDHLIAPKGMSFLSKTWDKVSHRGPSIPPPIPALPPPAPRVGHWYNFPSPALVEAEHGMQAEAAAGDFAGANLQAGWNRGGMPYGPWAVADPMAQYAHAAQVPGTGRQHQWYDWE
jgi:hypothetical protein